MVAAEGGALRLVFCGTPDFAVPSLQALVQAGHSVELVLTQPDRPQGRGLQVAASPVKQAALAYGIAVEQPEKLRNNDTLRALLERIAPDAIVVVAYGRIIPAWMLVLPRLGNINLHGSLLPKYRGAAPVQWALANGEPTIGATTMLLNEGLDTGPMLERLEIKPAPDAMAAALLPLLAEAGAPLVLSTLRGLDAGTLMPQPQDEAGASYAPILTREDGRMDCVRTARACYDRWRGFSPWPGAWALLGGKKFSVSRMRVDEGHAVQEPGTLLVDAGRLLLTCGEGTLLELLEVQMEGRRSMASADFLRGHPHMVGTRLG